MGPISTRTCENTLFYLFFFLSFSSVCLSQAQYWFGGAPHSRLFPEELAGAWAAGKPSAKTWADTADTGVLRGERCFEIPGFVQVLQLSPRSTSSVCH